MTISKKPPSPSHAPSSLPDSPCLASIAVLLVSEPIKQMICTKGVNDPEVARALNLAKKAARLLLQEESPKEPQRMTWAGAISAMHKQLFADGAKPLAADRLEPLRGRPGRLEKRVKDFIKKHGTEYQKRSLAGWEKQGMTTGDFTNLFGDFHGMFIKSSERKAKSARKARPQAKASRSPKRKPQP